jgi:hypothetical protein
MENATSYYIIQFLESGVYFNPNFLKTIDNCIRTNLIKSPNEFEKPLFLIKYPGDNRVTHYIRYDYLVKIFNDLK